MFDKDIVAFINQGGRINSSRVNSPLSYKQCLASFSQCPQERLPTLTPHNSLFNRAHKISFSQAPHALLCYFLIFGIGEEDLMDLRGGQIAFRIEAIDNLQIT